ncbi:MAG TPA: hypothetical protein VFI14_01555, partial [Chryseosolibacter sp.]|nr:hypothetical protein [Chryseosolibacter sp.]
MLLVFLPTLSFAQSSYAPLNADYYHWIDRYEIKSGKLARAFFSSVKPYKRSAIAAFIDSAKSEGLFSSGADMFNYEYLANDNWEWSASASAESRR